MSDAKPDTKPKYANFPEREPKVVIGAHINASLTKTLTRLTIGTYEMSFTQQEKGKATGDAARSAMNALAKQANLTVTTEESREFVAVVMGSGTDVDFKVWITTPFELTQAGHLVWTRYREGTGADAKIGIACKLATAFSADDITAQLKAAQKNAVTLPAGEPFVLKGNPAPRFQKKSAAPAGDAAAAPATGDAAEPAAG
jgi:hypothetical protein